LRQRLTDYRGEHERDPAWLDRSFPTLSYRTPASATFAYGSLIRLLILEAKAYQLKKGDGTDFCHAVIGGAFSSFATLDKHWKRRVGLLPQPNRLAKIYYQPEIDQLVVDVETAVAQLKAIGTGCGDGSRLFRCEVFIKLARTMEQS
jgi:hypothetical protein